ncbi:MAG: cyclic nucleotide-binding/CBS domain-containing protein [Haloferacaceae archaeon]
MDAPETTVRATMTTPVETVDGQTTVREAARVMSEERIGSLIVHGMYDDGIVTKTDLVVGMGHGVDPDSTPVEAVMSSPAVTVAPDVGLQEAVDRMAATGVKRLPVEEDGEMVGIVTTTDLRDVLAPDVDGVVELFADAE